MIHKPKVLFVGGFNKHNDGVKGGQLLACTTLIESELKNKVNFRLLDSTMESLPPPPLILRAFYSFKRIFIYLYELIFHKPNTVLIFSSAGLSFLEKGLMVFIGSLFSIRIVFSPRSGLLVDNIQNSWVMKKYVGLVFAKCHVVICQSVTWRNFYQEVTSLPLSKFQVIENWIQSSEYLKLPLKKKFSQPIQVLFLGWVEKNKGIFDLISAVKNNKELQSYFKFIICGSGSDFQNVQSIIKRSNLDSSFEFRGWVSGVRKIDELANADIFIMPSHREGLPNALLEAMASGCCVIASSVGAIPDIIIHGKNGFLIERQNPDQLANYLLYLASDPKCSYEIMRLAREKIKLDHDIEGVWKKIYAVLVSKNLTPIDNEFR